MLPIMYVNVFVPFWEGWSRNYGIDINEMG
jgi:hypothetical protein